MTAATLQRTWSPQQATAIDKVMKWFAEYNQCKSDKQIFRLFGFAGTGKTTLAIALAEAVRNVLRSEQDAEDDYGPRVLFAAFTGKAALVMQSKGCTGASTLHSLIYKTIRDEATGELHFALNTKSPLANADLLIIDECSMVGGDLGKDVCSFGVPILVLGDPFQLPPISGAGFFTSSKPDAMLTEIHRQARDNPIIDLSMRIRMGTGAPIGRYGESKIIPKAALDTEMLRSCNQLLVGTNDRRRAYNKMLRGLYGHEGALPVIGDKLICLQNQHERGLLNGSMWQATSESKELSTDVFEISLTEWEEANNTADIFKAHQFYFRNTNNTKASLPQHLAKNRNIDHFDFGYAITVHKSQGSQWSKVVVFNENYCFRESAAQWLYTAVTRAAESVIIAI